MKPEWRRFAPLGLYLALLAALVSAGLYIVQREWNLPLQISLGLIVIGLAVFGLLDPGRVRNALTGRQARYGSNALVLTVAFVGILVVINYLVFQNSKRWDLTEDKSFTLTPETLDTLKNLPEKVTAQGFFTARSNSETARSLLEQYAYNSDGKFEYEFINPEENPVAAQQAKVTRDGTIVLNMGGHQEQVTYAGEQDVTQALVRLMSPEERTVYFLTGHGEYSAEEIGDQAYTQVRGTLEGKNYTVKTLSLVSTNQIPEDAKAIIIAGPRKPVSPAEVSLLSDYLAKGGALIVMEEPLPLTEFDDAADPLADYLAGTWGIGLGKDIIVDTTSQQPFAPYAAQYGSHVITQKIETVTSQFPTARSVQITSVTGVSQVELVLTASQSWAEVNLQGLKDGSQQVAFDEGEDQLGPISMAVAAENLDTKARVVVFGDADFAIDANFSAYANGDLVISSVDWAVGNESGITLTPKTTTQRMVVPPKAIVMNLLLLGMVVVLPGLAFVAGIVVWIQRRRRG